MAAAVAILSLTIRSLNTRWLVTITERRSERSASHVNRTSASSALVLPIPEIVEPHHFEHLQRAEDARELELARRARELLDQRVRRREQDAMSGLDQRVAHGADGVAFAHARPKASTGVAVSRHAPVASCWSGCTTGSVFEGSPPGHRTRRTDR